MQNKIWIEQCEVAREIEDEFGTDKALSFLDWRDVLELPGNCRDGDMRSRWCVAGLLDAESRFRRVKSCNHMKTFSMSSTLACTWKPLTPVANEPDNQHREPSSTFRN
jgi:hypothetical protein